MQHITGFKCKGSQFEVYFCVSVRIYETIGINTVVPMSDIFPTPIPEIMLLRLLYLADTNNHPSFECVDFHWPFIVAVDQSIGSQTGNSKKDISVPFSNSAGDGFSLNFNATIFEPYTPFERATNGLIRCVEDFLLILIDCHCHYCWLI